jgi:hypothetical protein
MQTMLRASISPHLHRRLAQRAGGGQHTQAGQLASTCPPPAGRCRAPGREPGAAPGSCPRCLHRPALRRPGRRRLRKPPPAPPRHPNAAERYTRALGWPQRPGDTRSPGRDAGRLLGLAGGAEHGGWRCASTGRRRRAHCGGPLLLVCKLPVLTAPSWWRSRTTWPPRHGRGSELNAQTLRVLLRPIRS